ncbi:unnamed protein product, partial [Ectocarpus sp. 4 AP-2014]
MDETSCEQVPSLSKMGASEGFSKGTGPCMPGHHDAWHASETIHSLLRVTCCYSSKRRSGSELFFRRQQEETARFFQAMAGLALLTALAVSLSKVGYPLSSKCLLR